MGNKREELEVAKECFGGRLALAMDKPENVLGEALDDLTFRGTIMSPEQTLEKIGKVSISRL